MHQKVALQIQNRKNLKVIFRKKKAFVQLKFVIIYLPDRESSKTPLAPIQPSQSKPNKLPENRNVSKPTKGKIYSKCNSETRGI